MANRKRSIRINAADPWDAIEQTRTILAHEQATPNIIHVEAHGGHYGKDPLFAVTCEWFMNPGYAQTEFPGLLEPCAGSSPAKPNSQRVEEGPPF